MGDLKTAYLQIGMQTAWVETDEAATRRLYGKGTLNHNFGWEDAVVDSGTYDKNYISPAQGVEVAGGSISFPLFVDQLPEILRMAVANTPASGSDAGDGAYQWAFTPGDTLDFATLEWHDGHEAWGMRNAQINTLRIAGAAASGMLTVDATFIGSALAPTTMTPSLEEEQHYATPGWQVKLYDDALGATPGTTAVEATLIAYSVDLNNNLNPKYFGDNKQEAQKYSRGDRVMTFDLSLEASAAAEAVFANYKDGAERLIRLELGNNKVIGGTIKESLTIDIPCKLKAVDIGGEDAGTRMWRVTGENVYDKVNAFAFAIIVLNRRAT